MGPAAGAGALGAGYAALVAVNGVFGAGALGAPTNGELSAAYPAEVTPVGATFAIWGPIFALQGGGVWLMGWSAPGGARAAAAGGAWLATWAAEVVWQGVFATAPIPASKAGNGRKLATLAPAAALLVSAHAAMASGGAALRAAGARGAAGPSLLGALLVDLPTGLNAGWLAAASGIGLTLAAQHGPGWTRRLATPEGGAALLTALSAYAAGMSAFLASAPATAFVGAGYAFATAWACRGIQARPVCAPPVKRAARRGVWAAAAGLAAGLAWGALKRG